MVSKIYKPTNHDSKLMEATCLVSWYPPADGTLPPLDSEIPYKIVRKKAPELLISYYERNMIIR